MKSTIIAVIALIQGVYYLYTSGYALINHDVFVFHGKELPIYIHYFFVIMACLLLSVFVGLVFERVYGILAGKIIYGMLIIIVIIEVVALSMITQMPLLLEELIKKSIILCYYLYVLKIFTLKGSTLYSDQ